MLRNYPHALRNMRPAHIAESLQIMLSIEEDDVEWRRRVSWRKFATLETLGIITESPPRLTARGIEALGEARLHAELGPMITRLLAERATRWS